MAWFKGCLYVGTTRNNLCLIKSNPQRDTMRIWPVPCPDDVYTLDMRAQIWRYEPVSRRWKRVYVSPLVQGTNGRRVPRDIGYRKMIVFESPTHGTPCLYVCSMSWLEAPGAVVLRSADGENFEPVSEPGLKDTSVSSFRAMAVFNGRLYTSPAGEGRAFYSARAPFVLESKDPAAGDWKPVSLPGFGDPDNTAIVDLIVFNDHLYAGTLNPRTGMQIWKTKASGKPPYKWTQVLGAGAFRGVLNEGVLTFHVFQDALYVGSHISMGGHDRKNFVGPAPAELLRIYPDDSWDLLVGDPRQTPQGFKFPLSDRGAGFDNPFCGYLWAMADHDGWLYVGTFDSALFARYAHSNRMPARRRLQMQRLGIEKFVARRGGFDLWRSRDGDDWEPVSRNGFGNPYNYGVRNLVSTPHGLFLGTANPFGPKVAVKTEDDRWTYVPNKSGGLEVWLGRPAGDGQRPARGDKSPYVMRSGNSDQRRKTINEGYDFAMFDRLIEEYYEGSDFSNWGYWTPSTRSQKQACENLMERLLAFIPDKAGTILDVACGKGASTRHLLRYYPAENVTGINISAKQLERARSNAPGCEFLLMDAVHLEFPGNSFDNMICVEAAFHFNTREKFFRQAHRVLRPNGRLVLSDILFRPGVEMKHSSLNALNWVEDEVAYGHILTRAGFCDVRVIDATKECWHSFDRHRTAYIRDLLLSGRITWPSFWRILVRLAIRRRSVNHYVLAVGTKSA